MSLGFSQNQLLQSKVHLHVEKDLMEAMQQESS